MTAIARLAARQIRRSVLIILVVVAAMSSFVVLQFRHTFDTALELGSLQKLAESPAIRTLFGTPVALSDPGGFTVWRSGTFVAVLVALWSLLTATRITRGEEDAGRWDLVLTGRVPLAVAVATHLAVLLLAQLLIGAALAVAMTVSGADPRGSALYAVAVALIGMSFTVVGVAAAQVLPDRTAASGVAAAVLAAALLLRVIADGVDAAWVRWLTPFGLLATAQPYAANRVAPLVVLAVGTVVLAAVATFAAARRDLGAGLLRVAGTRRPRKALLGSVSAFAVRRTLRGLTAWSLGIAAYFLLIGFLAVSATDFLHDNPGYAEYAARAGLANLGTVEGYVAAIFTLLAIPVALYAVGRIASDAADETKGRLTMLLALPVPRARYAGIQTAVVSLASALLVIVAGVAAWVGTSVVGADLRLTASVAGAANVLPVALLSLGAALLAFGWVPQAVFVVGALPAVGGYLGNVLAQTFGWPHWVSRLSPFAHVATVPAQPPNWAGTVGLLAAAAVLGGIGVVGYVRRDLRA